MVAVEESGGALNSFSLEGSVGDRRDLSNFEFERTLHDSVLVVGKNVDTTNTHESIVNDLKSTTSSGGDEPSSTGESSKSNYWDSPLTWFSANHDPIFGMNYWTRYSALVASMLANFHKLPVEAVGNVIGIAGVGGVVDTYIIGKRVRDTVTALWNSKQTTQEFEESQNTLAELIKTQPKKENKGVETNPLTSENILNAAKEARSARAKKHKLDEAYKHTYEHMTDGVRYILVSWTVRTFFAVRLFLHTVTWLAQASGILGVVAGGLQMISGLLKWRSAQEKSSELKKIVKKLEAELEALKKLEELAAQVLEAEFDQLPKVDVQLERHLLKHIKNQRQKALHKAREKRFRAKCEAAAGTGALAFGVAALFVWPCIFGSIAVGLIYATFRIYKGVELYFSNRHENQQKEEWRQQAEQADDGVGNDHKLQLIEENPYYAVRYLVESMQVQDGVLWSLQDFLQKLGIPEANIQAVLLSAKDQPSAACKELEDMFFSEKWLEGKSGQTSDLSLTAEYMGNMGKSIS